MKAPRTPTFGFLMLCFLLMVSSSSLLCAAATDPSSWTDESYRLQKVVTAPGSVHDVPLNTDYRASLAPVPIDDDAGVWEDCEGTESCLEFRLQIKVANRFVVPLCLTQKEPPPPVNDQDSLPQQQQSQSFAVRVGRIGGTKMIPLDEEVRSLEEDLVEALSHVSRLLVVVPRPMGAAYESSLAFSSADSTVQIVFDSVMADQETEDHD
jgi:hypothetical protein